MSNATILALAVLALTLWPWWASHGQALHDVHENSGVTCAACHQETPPSTAPANSVCTACHGTMLDTGGEEQRVGPDPHASPHLGPEEVPFCNECHKIHRPSEVTWTACHGRTGVAHACLGSVAEDVLQRAYCDVLVAKAW